MIARRYIDDEVAPTRVTQEVASKVLALNLVMDQRHAFPPFEVFQRSVRFGSELVYTRGQARVWMGIWPKRSDKPRLASFSTGRGIMGPGMGFWRTKQG